MDRLDETRDGYTLSTDKGRLDVALIHQALSRRAYWAQGRPEKVVRRSIEHSLCFGIYDSAGLAAFARVVTDYATFAWLCDVFVIEPHRGRGWASGWSRRPCPIPTCRGSGCSSWPPVTPTGLYRRYGGFEALPNPGRWMVRAAPPLQAPR